MDKIKNIKNFFTKALTLISCIFFIILFVSIKKIGIIPFKFIVLIFFVMVMFIGGIYFSSKSEKKFLKISSIILTLIICFMSFWVSTNFNKTYEILSKITQFKEYSKVEYLIVSYKKNRYKSIDELNGVEAGLLDTNYKIVDEELSKKILFQYSKYDNLGDLVSSFVNEEIKYMVISEDIYEVIRENYVELYFDLDIIDKFTLSVKNVDNKKYDLNVKDSFIIYISGNDNGGEVREFTRSDVNLLLVVNPIKHKMLIVNTPRDYYVDVFDGQKKDKLTHASFYGIDKSVDALEKLYGVNIDGYIKMTYSALVEVVNQIDGVDVYSDQTFVTSHNKFKVNEGTNHFNGAQALAFSQERYAYLSGDRHRGENQQVVLSAIINKISTNKKYLLKYNDMLSGVDSYMSTNISLEEVQELIKDQIDTMAKWEINNVSVDGFDGKDYTYSMPETELYVMIPDDKTVKDVKEKIRNIMR